MFSSFRSEAWSSNVPAFGCASSKDNPSQVMPDGLDGFIATKRM